VARPQRYDLGAQGPAEQGEVAEQVEELVSARLIRDALPRRKPEPAT
jgi:hypothetical protein